MGVVCKQRQAEEEKKWGEKTDRWLRAVVQTQRAKKILIEKLALLIEKFVRSNGAIKEGLVQVGAGSLGKLKN